jgi:hypothetical protein
MALNQHVEGSRLSVENGFNELFVARVMGFSGPVDPIVFRY